MKMKASIYSSFNDYQAQAVYTAIYPDHWAIIYPTLGLTGEAGEVAEKVKKAVRGDIEFTDEAQEQHRLAVAKELGDVLWYVANLASDLGYSLQDVAEMSLAKLEDRKHRGTLQGEGDDR